MLMYTCLKVVFGDQSTCKNIRGAKRWSFTEIRELKKLQWANEVPGIHLASYINNYYNSYIK